MVGMIVVDNNIRKIEHFYWVPDTEFVEITGVYKASSSQITRRCRVGFDQIDSFMLNAKNCKERDAFDWYIDTDNFLSLPSSGKGYIWVLCLLAYYYMRNDVENHPVTLKVQEDLITWAHTRKDSDRPELSVRALRIAVALGSKEAVTHLSSDDYDAYFIDEDLNTKKEMDLS